MKILVTGTAGFIGFHLVQRLINEGHEVVGLDSINDYYDVNLKYGRLEQSGIKKELINYGKMIKSGRSDNYTFIKMNLEDYEGLEKIFKDGKFDVVCNLAAQAGVRYSLENPRSYIKSNIDGFLNILEGCRHNNVNHLVYASSSSVYGLNEKLPFCTSDNVDHPISLYAATKKSNELMAHTYSNLFKIPTTGLRFFTVYGPWGRPDMAPILFTKAILENEPINVFNNGNMMRDFTYVDDIVEGIVRVLDKPPAGNCLWDGKKPDPGSSKNPYKLYNIGNGCPVKLLDFIEALEESIGKKAEKIFLPMQPGDVPSTWADVDDLIRDTGYKPKTGIKEGVMEFVKWYKNFYNIL